MMKLEYEDLPTGWQLCFLAQCKHKDECLRYQAGLTLPDDVYTANAVTPNALKQAQCPCFRRIEVVHAAAGFEHIFHEVKARHAPEMRSAIVSYLHGNGTYYRYLHGDRSLMPEQQEWIRQLFKDYGYTEEIEFDGYKDCYRFYDN